MKQTHTLKLLLIMMMTILLASCIEEDIVDNPTTPAIVKFPNATMGISELAGPTDITLSLGKPATQAGTVTLKVETDHADDFTTDPSRVDGKIVIPVAVGQSQVKFILTPVHNNLHHGNKQIDFTIDAVTDGLIIGTEKVLAVTIFEIDQPNLVNFVSTQGSLIENSEEGFYISIGFSLMAMGQGVVEVEITNDVGLYGTYFTTEPAAVGGKITLAVETGIGHLPIKFIPINNSTLNGHKEIGLTITNATGAVAKGNQLSFNLSLKDDELMGKPKSYETSSGTWKDKRVYEYNEAGKISKITWIQNALSGVYTFHYNEVGELIKRQEDAITETRYIRNTQGQIVLSEKFQGGVLKKYTMYGYDPAGNIGEEAIFDLQPSGEFLMTSVFVNLYDINTNQLVNRLLYNPQTANEEFELMQEETYEYFVQYYPANQFPMVEIIPGWNIQTMYPSRYTKNHYGMNFTYDFSYVFNDKAMPIRRNITNNTETTTYEYY